MRKSDQSTPSPAAGTTQDVAILANAPPGEAGYTVLIRTDGTGYSCCRFGGATTALTHWTGQGGTAREGLQVFLRDRDTGAFWALGAGVDSGAGVWSPGRYTITQTQDGIRATLEVCVVADAPAEVRRLTLANLGETARRLDVTSLAEVVLNDAAAHAAHPAFSKLFLQTEHVPGADALLVSRRPRDPHERHPVLVHAVVDAPRGAGAVLPGGGVEIETDRARFFGRGRNIGRPAAMTARGRLSGTTGNVLDPVVSLRLGVDLPPGRTATVVTMLGAETDRPAALALVEACRRDLDGIFAAARAQALGRPADDAARQAGTSPLPPGLLTPGFAPPDGDRPRSHPGAAAGVTGDSFADPTGPGLAFFNGIGGFDAPAREYVIRLEPAADDVLHLPPRPWTNVLANEQLGCIVSETGAGCTWYGNSREHRLTPWFNDPVLDPHGDALYLRDDRSGAFFSCLPGPSPAGGAYEVRHGFGYTRFRRRGGTPSCADLDVQTLLFVAPAAPVRVARVRVTNRGPQTRRLSLFSYQQLVLGGLAQEDAPAVVTAAAVAGGGLLARTGKPGPFAGHVAFAAAVRDGHVTALHHTADRTAFLGPDRDPARPAALALPVLDGRCGAGLDPCFALQAILQLEAGGTAEVSFLLGQERDLTGATALVADLCGTGAVEAAGAAAKAFWHDGLDAVQVGTPSPALDLMVNGWLGYQTLSCRMRARSAFYQSGGAYGFRDQLQDSLALLPLWPELTRRQILLHAGHQFVEGDVLHWWHPPLSRGIRTRFADDLLWLPFAAAQYVQATGEVGILAESAPFLTADPLPPDQDEVLLQPSLAPQSADLYEHCCRALDRSLTRGAHGLPLFGTGDWNDGMNRVGREGRGESVWMGFFLVVVIDGFVPLCEGRGDGERAARYRAYRDEMVRALNEGGWDGGWYRRGYFDDGSTLGSAQDAECRIDALVQAWAVLSGAAPPARAARVMDAVEEHLIDDEARLIRLLTPPFVDTPHDPGYIRGYVAGVRENGGQYTHAALWVVMAMARLGRRNRAAALLDLLNPALQAATPAQVARYQVEPYVVAADVYGAAPHVGRGGWTWYTGSSGWMLRAALESVLGLRPEGETLVIAPCVPDAWPHYRVAWRVPGGGGTRYEIAVDNPRRCSETVVAVALDGQAVSPVEGTARLPLLRDGRTHRVTVTLGPRKD